MTKNEVIAQLTEYAFKDTMTFFKDGSLHFTVSMDRENCTGFHCYDKYVYINTTSLTVSIEYKKIYAIVKHGIDIKFLSLVLDKAEISSIDIMLED